MHHLSVTKKLFGIWLRNRAGLGFVFAFDQHSKIFTSTNQDTVGRDRSNPNTATTDPTLDNDNHRHAGARPEWAGYNSKKPVARTGPVHTKKVVLQIQTAAAVLKHPWDGTSSRRRSIMSRRRISDKRWDSHADGPFRAYGRTQERRTRVPHRARMFSTEYPVDPRSPDGPNARHPRETVERTLSVSSFLMHWIRRPVLSQHRITGGTKLGPQVEKDRSATAIREYRSAIVPGVFILVRAGGMWFFARPGAT